jgi:hypothetical protein
MRNFLSKSALRFGLRSLLLLPVFFVGETCTKLTEVPHDALTPATAFHTDQEVLAGVAGVYAQLRAVEWVGYETLEDLTTDVSVVPTRGSDWYDNGQWLDLHRQTWTPNSAGTLAFLDGAYNDLFSGVAKANLMLDVIKTASPSNKDQLTAELRALRAWYYYMLQDMFGGVPLVTSTALAQAPRVTRDSVFRFLVKELSESATLLPAKWDAANYGRLTKGAANAILASLYLNAGVFNKDCGPADCSGKVSASAYNTCNVTVPGATNGCAGAITAASAVLNDPNYQLNPNWSKNFSTDNKSSKENIFVVVHTNGTQAIGGNWPMRTLHYNQLNTGDGAPWNGFATIAETYNQFTATDVRRSMWLAGQGFSFESGQPVNDRTGAPLNFTPAIANLNAASEGEGVRFNKFPPQPDPPHGSAQPNDFTFFRLAEMYLIKAEAENELGQTAQAIADLKSVHDLRDPGTPISAALSAAQVRDAIYKERLLEFAAEGKRRTDMIRYGRFLSWTESSANGVCGANPAAGCPARAAHRIVFPISVNALGSNPALKQNFGY